MSTPPNTVLDHSHFVQHPTPHAAQRRTTAEQGRKKEPTTDRQKKDAFMKPNLYYSTSCRHGTNFRHNFQKKKGGTSSTNSIRYRYRQTCCMIRYCIAEPKIILRPVLDDDALPFSLTSIDALFLRTAFCRQRKSEKDSKEVMLCVKRISIPQHFQNKGKR